MTKPLAQVLLAPQSVAIIGQSNDAAKTAGRPLKYLRQAGYAGRIYPINPRRDEVLGERAWPSLAALPEVPDHAYIVASTEATMEAIEECARLGVPVVTALANGFSETGAEGTAREARIRQTAARSGTRLVGPSSLGVVDLRHKTFLTANAAFDEPDLPVGRIFAASHSGGMIGTFLSRGKARGIGFAGLVSVGNEVDLSIGEICAATLDDPGIDGYVLFLETMRKAHALRAFALEAAKRGKPVLAYKLGRSAAARELAVSHTGALAGEDDVAGMFLAECGIARVETLEGLIEGFPLLARVPARRREARERPRSRWSPPPPAAPPWWSIRWRCAASRSSRRRRRHWRASRTPPASTSTPARIVDLTLAGAQYKVMKGALDVLTTAPEFDLVVVVVGSSARFYPDLAVKPIIDSAGAGKPIAAFLVPEAPDALARLAAAGVPSFHTPEACADAVAAALQRRAPRPIEVRSRKPAGTARDARRAGGLCAARPRSACRARRRSRSMPTSRRRPPCPLPIRSRSRRCRPRSRTSPMSAASCSMSATTRRCWRPSRKSGERTKVDRVLVQPMMSGLGEVLIGYRVDRESVRW